MSKPEVLIVEDDEAMRGALVRLVTTAGFDVRAFACAEDVLAADPPAGSHCFVIDIRLPGVSGVELHRRLVEAGRSAPAIFMTGYDDPGLRRSVERSGGAAFLAKPFPGKTLISAIKRAIAAAS